jgi:hypothetical protein
MIIIKKKFREREREVVRVAVTAVCLSRPYEPFLVSSSRANTQLRPTNIQLGGTTRPYREAPQPGVCLFAHEPAAIYM